MKRNYIVTLLLFSALSLHANELAWVDEQVKAIKPARVGIDSATINKVKDPFIFLKKKMVIKKKRKPVIKQKPLYSSIDLKSTNTKSTKRPTKPKKSLRLELIINKSVKINGEWYKLNSKVDGYTISAIHSDTVVLTKSGSKIILSTSLGKNQNIKFKN